MLIGVVVHPVDVAAHPTVPLGYRWAVHIGSDWSDLRTCLNAGWQPDQHGAALAGEAAAVCAVKALRFCGKPAGTETSYLQIDPTGGLPELILSGA